MLPYEDVISIGEELQRRFGLPFWQFTLTATDANHFVLRMARMLTGPPKVLVFNYCYHGRHILLWMTPANQFRVQTILEPRSIQPSRAK
jgi:glutamate-1-semialdehyde aminotransferase